MRCLTSTEISKVLSSRFIMPAILFLVVCVAVISAFASSTVQNDSAARNAYDAIINDPEGTAEYYEDLGRLTREQLLDDSYRGPSTYSPDGSVEDLASLTSAYARLDYLDNHEKTISNFIEAAKIRILDLNSYGFDDDTYEVRYQKALLSRYEQVRGTVSPESEYAYGYDKYLNMNITSVFVIVAVTLIVSYIFSNERYTGFSHILRSTKRGRGHTIAAKLSAVLIICTAVSVLFYAVSFTTIGLTNGYSSVTAPAQIIPDFYAVPYKTSILGYLLLNFSTKLTGFLAYAAFLSAVSCAFKSYVISFAAGGAFWAVNLIPYSGQYSGTVPAVKYTNYAALVWGNENSLFYRCVSVFGYPVSHTGLMLMISAGIIVICAVFCLIFDFKTRSLKTGGIMERKIKKRSVSGNKRTLSTSLVVYEFAKIRGPVIILVILVLLAVKAVYMCVSVPDMNDYGEALYYRYIEIIHDMNPEERSAFLESERSRITGIINSYDEKKADYESSLISAGQYSDYLREYYQARADHEVFQRTESYVYYIDLKNEITGRSEKPIYSTGYESLFTENADWFLMAAFIAIGFYSFAVEYSGTSSRECSAKILRTTKKGRDPTFRTKVLITAIMSGAASAVFRITDLIVVSGKFVIPNTDAALFCVELFDRTSPVISILAFIMLDIALRIAAGMMLAVLICSISLIGKKTISVLLTSTVVLAIPEILSVTVFRGHPEISLMTTTCLYRLLINAPEVFSGTGAAVIWFTICIIMIAIVAMAAYLLYVRSGYITKRRNEP